MAFNKYVFNKYAFNESDGVRYIYWFVTFHHSLNCPKGILLYQAYGTMSVTEGNEKEEIKLHSKEEVLFLFCSVLKITRIHILIHFQSWGGEAQINLLYSKHILIQLYSFVSLLLFAGASVNLWVILSSRFCSVLFFLPLRKVLLWFVSVVFKCNFNVRLWFNLLRISFSLSLSSSRTRRTTQPLSPQVSEPCQGRKWIKVLFWKCTEVIEEWSTMIITFSFPSSSSNLQSVSPFWVSRRLLFPRTRSSIVELESSSVPVRSNIYSTFSTLFWKMFWNILSRHFFCSSFSILPLIHYSWTEQKRGEKF